MTAPFYFISYSRSQLYFAESVAVELERMKVDVWFDLQQLKTGEDWASEIKRGLDECAGVVLIVSQRSMASKYVELEWKAALDAGKPVYLLYFEPAELTDERLKSCPVVDGRGRFKPAVRQLARAINAGETPQEGARFRTVRPPKRLARLLAADDDGAMRFPTKLSPGVLLITLSMLGISAALVMAMLMTWMIFGLGFSLWLGGLAGYGILASSHYVRRKLVGEPPRFFVMMSLFGALAMLAVFFPYPSQQQTMAVLAGIIGVMTAVFVFAYVFRGGDVLRWTLTGFAGERRRRRHHGGRWVRRAGTGNHSVSYRVLHSRGDEKFAAQLVKAMQKYKHVPASDDADRDDTFDFFLVSNVTVWDEVRAAVEAHPRLIAAAMTSVKLPEDVYQKIGRFQYLDARTDAKRRFEVMAASLTEKEVQSNSLSASLETTPANLDLTVIPRRVAAGLGTLRLYAIAGLVAPVLVVLQMIINRAAMTGVNLSVPVLVVSLVLGLIFALFCFGLDHLTRSRQITTRMFMAVYTAGMLIYSVGSAALGGVQILGAELAQGPWAFAASIVIVFLTSAGLFAWLPAVQPRALSFAGVRAEGGNVARDVVMISTAATYATFAIFPVLIFGGIGAIQSFGATTSIGSQTQPVFYTSTMGGNLTVRFPSDLSVFWIKEARIDTYTVTTSVDSAVLASMQEFIDQASPNLGETFTPTYAAYALNEQGVLTLVGGQFVVQAEDDSADYARQRLAEQIAGLAELDAAFIYEPAYTFGSGANAIPGAFASVSIPAEDGMPMKVSFAAIDTATAHHMIYIVSTESAPMQALVEQLFALIQGTA
jgi:hypothetical protein